MKKLALFGTVLMLVTVLAVTCTGGSDDEPLDAPVEETESAPAAQPTIAAPPDEPVTVEPEAYPARPTPIPPAAENGYPAYEAQPSHDPYPGGLAVILHPVGRQCEEPVFPDLNAAIVALEESGIIVLAAEEIALNVCTACSCPTSEHYRIQINPEDLNNALELGWTRG